MAGVGAARARRLPRRPDARRSPSPSRPTPTARSGSASGSALFSSMMQGARPVRPRPPRERGGYALSTNGWIRGLGLGATGARASPRRRGARAGGAVVTDPWAWALPARPAPSAPRRRETPTSRGASRQTLTRAGAARTPVALVDRVGGADGGPGASGADAGRRARPTRPRPETRRPAPPRDPALTLTREGRPNRRACGHGGLGGSLRDPGDAAPTGVAGRTAWGGRDYPGAGGM